MRTVTKSKNESTNTFTKEDLKKAYNAGHRAGGLCGIRLIRRGELETKSFEEWYKKYHGL